MLKRLFTCILILACLWSHAQQPDKAIADTSINYDELFSAMDEFLDSLLAPHSFTIINVGVGNNVYDFQTSASSAVDTRKLLTYSPSIGYFHKNGLGLAMLANVVNDGTDMNVYQAALTGSYDYIKNNHFVTGAGYTRFFTKSSLPFYTSPLQNSMSAYFLYRKLWFKPSLNLTYGWGSRTSYEDRSTKILSLRLKEKGYTRVNKQESINDFSVSFSVKHDFYWLNVLSKKDYIKLSPQLSFTGGSQQFGLNQSTSTYGTTRVTGNTVLFNSDQTYLDDTMYFQPLSITASIKFQYSFGRFYVQPQLLGQYYIPGTSDHISSLFLLNAGVVF